MTAPCLVPAGRPPQTAFSNYYIGKPGTMTKLSLPDNSVTAPLGRGEVAHALSSGGTTTTRKRRAKRVLSVSFGQQSPDEADAMLGYYLGARGNGPFCWVDPGWRNQLGGDASTFGSLIAANTAWAVPTADTQPLVDTTIAPPTGLLNSAVLRWPTPTNGHVLLEGSQTAGPLVPSSSRAVPYLSDLAAVLTVWGRTATGTASAKLYALGLAAAGNALPLSGIPNVNVTCALTTTWQMFTVLIPAGSFTPATSPYICAAIAANSAGGPDTLWAAAQLSYGTAAALPWVTGLGVPRVTLSAGVPVAQTVYWRRSHSFTLSEV